MYPTVQTCASVTNSRRENAARSVSSSAHPRMRKVGGFTSPNGNTAAIYAKKGLDISSE